MVDAICREIEIQKNYLPNIKLETIYFGGGTPSLLSENELNTIFHTVRTHFEIDPEAEITLEANPDDLTVENFQIFKNAGINRLSIGVQSFNSDHLKFMNRAHNEIEAIACITNAQKAGFQNITIDLIYGIRAENHDILLRDLELATQFGIDHISAYCLTIEPKTTFGSWLKNNKMKPIDENFASEQFEILMESLVNNGFEQYEISNFARKNQYSKHNSSYWLGKPYLGVGPSAHSYNGVSRQYNISNNSLYIKSLEKGELNFEKEILSLNDKTNEYLLTSLRTKWGAEIAKLQTLSDGKFLQENEKNIQKFVEYNWLKEKSQVLYLTKTGKFFADRISSEMFI